MADALRPFSGQLRSAGELLHTPYWLPTSMATTLLSSRSYAFSLDTSCHLAAVLCFTVEPALSDLLTKPRPTTDSATLRQAPIRLPGYAPIESLRVVLGLTAQLPPVISFTRRC